MVVKESISSERTHPKLEVEKKIENRRNCFLDNSDGTLNVEKSEFLKNPKLQPFRQFLAQF